MSYTGQFKDNRPYGQFRHFDRYDSTITIVDYFRDGYAAKATHFYPNGNLKAIGFYLDENRDSTWEFYNRDGRLLKRENYQYGRLHGLAETFDKDGNCVDSTEWFRSLRNGRWWHKTQDGGTQSTTYKLNHSHGVYERYFANGNLYIKGLYEEGSREGAWYYYHDNGLLDRVMQFKHGLLVKKQVAIKVAGKDILLDSDSVAYMYTNGRITEIKMLNGTTYRPVQTFDQLVKSFDTDEFFLADPRFFVPFRLFDSFVIEPEDERKLNAEPLADETAEAERRRSIKGLLRLKIPMPYDVVVDGEVILMLREVTSSKPVIEQ
jgi:antitoxin component YwqK of YwqJK toxin-antitoxin module